MTIEGQEALLSLLLAATKIMITQMYATACTVLRPTRMEGQTFPSPKEAQHQTLSFFYSPLSIC
jgi:hypothetical protein